ncbi:MAG TPA: hypothetical protein VKW09_10270 [bacterium]|nr:hypothetical protein [bacterium]
MFEVIGATAYSALYAALVGVLVGFSPARRSTKLAVAAAAALWGVIVVTIAGFGLGAPGAAGGVPIPVVAFAVFSALLFGAWAARRQFRDALLSVPLPALVALNVGRVAGILMAISAAQGRISAPFGPAAGWGDALTGALAIPVAAIAATRPKNWGWVFAWNLLGAADLIDAVTLGALSAPGTPFRVFTEGPGTGAMGALPWIMIPTMLVPLYFLIHFTIAAKIRFEDQARGAVLPARSAA